MLKLLNYLLPMQVLHVVTCQNVTEIIYYRDNLLFIHSDRESKEYSAKKWEGSQINQKTTNINQYKLYKIFV